MYSLKVESYFSSAHNLRGYKGKCEELHGHNWKVEVTVAKRKLDKLGMVLDFKYLKKELDNILERLDHRYLNDLPYFKKVNPTSENIASYIYRNLKGIIAEIQSVTVWESDNSSACYRE